MTRRFRWQTGRTRSQPYCRVSAELFSERATVISGAGQQICYRIIQKFTHNLNKIRQSTSLSSERHNIVSERRNRDGQQLFSDWRSGGLKCSELGVANLTSAAERFLCSVNSQATTHHLKECHTADDRWSAVKRSGQPEKLVFDDPRDGLVTTELGLCTSQRDISSCLAIN